MSSKSVVVLVSVVRGMCVLCLVLWCVVLCRPVWVLVLVCNVRLLRVCVCVVCGAACHAGKKNVYVQNASVCTVKTPARVQHAGVLQVHTETFLTVHTEGFFSLTLSLSFPSR